MTLELAWATFGLLATTVAGMFGMFFYLARRMDSGFSAVNSRIDSLGGRIDAQGARLDARIDALSTQLSAHVERHAG